MCESASSFNFAELLKHFDVPTCEWVEDGPQTLELRYQKPWPRAFTFGVLTGPGERKRETFSLRKTDGKIRKTRFPTPGRELGDREAGSLPFIFHREILFSHPFSQYNWKYIDRMPPRGRYGTIFLFGAVAPGGEFLLSILPMSLLALPGRIREKWFLCF